MTRQALIIYPVLFTAAISVSACNAQWTPASYTNTVSVEKLLAAEGRWHYIDSESGLDPAAQHLAARRMVNPDVQNTAAYTKKVAEAPQEGENFRVLRLDRGTRDPSSDFGRIMPPKPKLLAQREGVKQVPVPKPTPRRTLSVAAIGQPVVTALRIGDHPGKTRVVLDVNGNHPYSYDVDNEQRVLRIDLGKAVWTAPEAASYRLHPLVKGYRAEKSAQGGTLLIVELKKTSKVLGVESLRPNQTKGPRIYFDIAAL